MVHDKKKSCYTVPVSFQIRSILQTLGHGTFVDGSQVLDLGLVDDDGILVGYHGIEVMEEGGQTPSGHHQQHHQNLKHGCKVKNIFILFSQK
jgi:hypothetical protein